jgi:hypothetical protein
MATTDHPPSFAPYLKKKFDSGLKFFKVASKWFAFSKNVMPFDAIFMPLF